MNTINPFLNQQTIPQTNPIKAKVTSDLPAAADGFTKSAGAESSVTTDAEALKTTCRAKTGLTFKSKFMMTTHSLLAALMIATAVMPGPAFAAGGASANSLDPTVSEEKARVELSVAGEDKDFFNDAKDVYQRVSHPDYVGKIGDYGVNIDYINARVRAKPKVKPTFEDGKFDAGWRMELRPKAELMNTEIVKTQQDGKWFEAQGVRGRITGEWRLGYEGGNTKEANGINELEVRSGADVFKTWYRDIGENMHLQIDAVGGGSHEFMNNHSELHLNFRQRVTGENLEIMSQKFGWYAEAQQNVNYTIQNKELNPGYEFTGGLKKDIPVKAFGHKAVLKAELGARIKGDSHDAFDIGPVTRLKVDF
jgi:hypothetical protein